MTDDAVRVQAALAGEPKTETEIAVHTGLTLVETSNALNELAVLGVVVGAGGARVRLWTLREVAV